MRKVLSKRELTEMVGLSYPTLWRLMRRGEFPKPVPLSENRVAWLESEVSKWLVERVQARDAGVVDMRQPPQRKREPAAT